MKKETKRIILSCYHNYSQKANFEATFWDLRLLSYKTLATYDHPCIIQVFTQRSILIRPHLCYDDDIVTLSFEDLRYECIACEDITILYYCLIEYCIFTRWKRFLAILWSWLIRYTRAKIYIPLWDSHLEYDSIPTLWSKYRIINGITTVKGLSRKSICIAYSVIPASYLSTTSISYFSGQCFTKSSV